MPASSSVRSWSLAALLASLSMLGTFSVDVYLPAFPAIAEDLHASPLQLQQTLSVYMIAYAFMMLWHGSLSDALGRRPIVLVGLVVYAVGTLGCAIAGNIESLWLFRMIQGLSAGSGLVVGRAIIRDRFRGPEAQRLMSQITLVFGIAPALAPVVGGTVLNLLGWRAIFWVLFAIVAAMLWWTTARLPESLPLSHRQPLRPGALWHNYSAVLRSVDFLLLATMSACNFGAFFTYIAAAPTFLIDRLGVTTLGFAWLFVPMIAGVMLGATISGRLAGRRSPWRTVHLGYAIIFLAVLVNLLVSFLLPPRPIWNVAPIFIFTIGSSIVFPSVTLLLLDLFPTMRGLASSLQGFVQFALGAIDAALIAPLLALSLPSLALGMAAFAVTSVSAWMAFCRRNAEKHVTLTS